MRFTIVVDTDIGDPTRYINLSLVEVIDQLLYRYGGRNQRTYKEQCDRILRAMHRNDVEDIDGTIVTCTQG